MKSNKQKKIVKNSLKEDVDNIKPKTKKGFTESKINIKSKKFWEDVYDDEGDEVEKFLR